MSCVGVLFQIKKNAKTRYKYEVRRLKRRQDNLLQNNKLAKLFTRNEKKKFWSEIRWLNHTQPRSIPCVDGVSGSTSIANIFASKFKGVLNRNPNALQTSFYSTLQSSVTDTLISEVYFSEEDVEEAIHELNPRKYDVGGVCTEHLKFASSVISESLAPFFTSVARLHS